MVSHCVTLLLFQYFIYANTGQVLYVETQRNWEDAEADCQNRGSHLLTATTTSSNRQDCIDQANTNVVWVGLNRISDGDTWQWSSNIQYNSDDVIWGRNDPRTDGDCAQMKVSGNGEGTLRNKNIACTSEKSYCCDPVDQDAQPSATTTTTTTSIPRSDSTTTTRPIDVTTTTTQNNNDNKNCVRLRKEWNTASQPERDLYINGMLRLSQLGILDIFTEQHGEEFATAQAHSTSAFLPWHRLFLNQLEDAIRSLGGEYECFSLLYWNWALDASTFGQDYSRYSILNSGLGSSGDSRDSYCVTDGAFAKGNYIPFYCSNSWRSRDGTCCLRRRTASRNSGDIHSNSEMANTIVSDAFYGNDRDDDDEDGFRENIEGAPHANAHCTMGDCGSSGGHLGHALYSPDDPIFYLLHGYVDFIWAIWQDTNDYDLVSESEINNIIYDGQLHDSDIDVPLIFDTLTDQNWQWLTLTGRETARDVHNLEQLGVKYEKGSFFEDVRIDESNINSNWFVDNSENTRRRIIEQSKYEQTRYGFEQRMYVELMKEYGSDYIKTKHGRKEIISAWSKIECSFKNSVGRECNRPQYFDDCSDMELIENEFGKKDIEISLDELIEKVSDYPCMIETRQRFYYWAKQFRVLKHLCRGDFDRFCDKEFLKGKKKNKCREKIDNMERNKYNSMFYDYYY